MDAGKIRLIAFDLDGTLTQHKTPLGEENRAVLEQLSRKYHLLMVGAGSCARIHRQMNGFPLDIIGNYGMQFAQWDAEKGELAERFSESRPVDRDEALRRAALVREKFGLHDFAGDTMEFHATGMLTLPILGTKAAIGDKLAYDPDRSKRHVMYPFVKKLFCDYTVFIGGSSSFDIVPKPFCKAYALQKYLGDRGMAPENALYCGDDYGPGGNDFDVHESGIPFLEVDDYRATGALLKKIGVL